MKELITRIAKITAPWTYIDEYDGKEVRGRDTILLKIGCEVLTRSSDVVTLLEIWVENGGLVADEWVQEVSPWGAKTVYHTGYGKTLEKDELKRIRSRLERAVVDIEKNGWKSPYRNVRDITGH